MAERADSRRALHATARRATRSAAALAAATALSGMTLLPATRATAAETPATPTPAHAHPAATSTRASCPQPFKITLDVEWHGMDAGTSTLQLTRQSPTEYTYQSSNTA